MWYVALSWFVVVPVSFDEVPCFLKCQGVLEACKARKQSFRVVQTIPRVPKVKAVGPLSKAREEWGDVDASDCGSTELEMTIMSRARGR